MTTPRISYAHLLTEPNPKHVESLVKFFESGCQERGTGGFGVEIEHLPVHNSDDTAVNYYEENGVEALLNRIRPYYDESKEYWENGRLVGLGREGISVSLEPGGQLECSLGILHKPEVCARFMVRSAAKSILYLTILAFAWSITGISRSPAMPTFPSIRRIVTSR